MCYRWSIGIHSDLKRFVNSSMPSAQHWDMRTFSPVVCAGSNTLAPSARRWVSTKGSTIWASNSLQITWTSSFWETIKTRSALMSCPSCLARGKLTILSRSLLLHPETQESLKGWRQIISSVRSASQIIVRVRNYWHSLVFISSTQTASKSGFSLRTGVQSVAQR